VTKRAVPSLAARTELGAVLVAMASEDEMTLAEMAGAIGTSESTLRRIITGECEPNASVLERIAQYILPDNLDAMRTVLGMHRIRLCVR
jgi:transcriptional regulator with XRE-family HTH domain